MRPLRRATLIAASAGAVELQLELGWRARVSIADANTGRVTLLPPDGWREPRTWALDPQGVFPLEGRRRDEIHPPDASATATQDGDAWLLAGENLRARIALLPFAVAWQQRGADGAWRTCCADRDESYAYGVSQRCGTVWHWQRRDPAHERYFGLGDKTGPIDLAGRRLRTRQLDALGYDAKTGDPLYKHWPFFLDHLSHEGQASACGLYYDTLAECAFDFGAEHDNYHGRYRATEIADGDLDFYVFAGPTLREALARFVAAIGGTALPPRWSLGFANTAMGLADAPDAQAQIRAFLGHAERDGFPLSSFHFGSGYTSRGKQRYVFTWNLDKFPEPRALTAAFAAAGVRTVANLKPCLLDDHPAYAALAAGGAFLRDERGPCLEQFWDGWGAHLDFTRRDDAAWWQTHLQQQVLDVGIDVGWNDNNEYELWGETARADGFGEPLPVARSRPLQALLMTRATFDQQATHKPQERVYTITRGGCPGLQRYAQTWTGDNSTSWHTMRWNQRMALTMSLSGMFNTGHDIGGFDGPVPDAEMLIRWTQACCLVPRMIMNSWKADGSVNSPWLHAEATAPIRAAVGLRLKLLPYLYSQLWRSTREHLPLLRPTCFDFGDDRETWHDNDEMMVGPDLLAAPVFEPGARKRKLYLPRHAQGWFDWWTGAHHGGGQEIEVTAPLHRLPLFVRGGALVPTTDSPNDHARTEEPSRALLWFPGRQGDDAALLYEDDGLRPADAPERHVLHRFAATAHAARLDLALTSSGAWPLPYAQIRIVLPPGEARKLALQSPAGGVTLVA
jgi:alpha-glucosidase